MAMLVWGMPPAAKTDKDLRILCTALEEHYQGNKDVQISWIPADNTFRPLTRIKIKGRLFVLLSDGSAYTFTELHSVDKDYTVNNLEELVDTIDAIESGWQPKNKG
jgi:hypothetical protein